MYDSEVFFLYVLGIVISIFIVMFLMRWIFRIDKLIKYQEGIIAALFEIAKKQGVSQDRIDGITNSIKH
jgi:hypothetical protein